MESPESCENTKHTISEDMFYNFLSSEIDHLKNEIKKPGWTNWAIMGGLATIVWLTFNEFDNNALRIHNISFIIITSVFIHRILSIVQLSLADYPTSKSETKYLPSNEVLGQSRVSLVLQVLKYAFLIYLISILPLGIEKRTITLLYITTSVYAFVFACGLIFSYLHIPFGLNTKRSWKINIPYYLLGILVFYIAYKLVYFYVNHSNDFDISDFRFSALFVGGFYLVVLLCQIPQDSRILSSLIEIRRKLVFHNLNITEAVRQTEIALTGLKASNLLQDYVVDFLKICDEFNYKNDLILKKLEIIDAMANKKERSEISATDIEISQSIMDSIDKTLEELENLLSEDMPRVFRPFKMRVVIISRISKQANNEILSLVKQLEDALESMRERTQKVKSRIKSISNKS